MRAVDGYLHELRESKTPVSLHVLGEASPEDVLVPDVTQCSAGSFSMRVAAVLPRMRAAHEAGVGSESVREKADEVVDS